MNIMTLRNAAFGGLALLLAACGQGPEATGFITENLPPPDGAATKPHGTKGGLKTSPFRSYFQSVPDGTFPVCASDTPSPGS